MKIVFLSYLHGYGGAEKQNIMLANAMANLGHDIVLVSISVNNVCYKLDEKVKYIFLPDKKKGIQRILSRYNMIKKILKQEQPDLTVNFWFQSTYLLSCMNKKITGKIIYSERGDPSDKEYKGILGLIRKLVFPRVNGFVFQTIAAKSYFNTSIQNRSTVIGNPVIINYDNIPKNIIKCKKIVNVGRLHEQKNQMNLIDAFSKISKKHEEYILEIFGEGELYNKLSDFIHEKKLDNKVFLKGTSKNIHREICNASLFVLSSDYEGMPNALLEAMALGLPCISTNWKPGGVVDIIDNRENGIIVPCNDADLLSKAMDELLENQKLANNYSKKAIETSKKFYPQKIYNEWEKYLKNILNRG